MGFLYIYPQDLSEEHYIQWNHDRSEVTIKSYSLPWIFHLFIILISATLIILASLSGSLLWKLAIQGESIDRLLVSLVLLCYLGCQIALLAAFFGKCALKISLKHIKAGIILGRKFIPLRHQSMTDLSLQDLEQALKIEHFLESPNYARIHSDPQMKDFQNRGHFLLLFNSVPLDRSSRKQDLQDLKQIILKSVSQFPRKT